MVQRHVFFPEPGILDLNQQLEMLKNSLDMLARTRREMSY
jgi:hypothetical protein